MLDKLKNMPAIILRRYLYPCSGTGKKIDYVRLFNYKMTSAECNILSLKQRNAPKSSSRMPLLFLHDKLSAGYFSIQSLSKPYNFQSFIHRLSRWMSQLFIKTSNDPILSTPTLDSKPTNGKQSLSITHPVSIVCVK